MTHQIAGARGAIKDHEAVLRRAAQWATQNRSEILLSDARCVFGRDHLESAALHAERAKLSGTMTSRSLPMETLLYLAAQSQVSDAIRIAGVRPDTTEIAVIIFGPGPITAPFGHFGWIRDDAVLDPGVKSKAVLGVTAGEQATVLPGQETDLVLEKVALVDVTK